jgi:hypothetical protein
MTSEQKSMRLCRNCGESFKPYHSGDFYCGRTKDCDDAAAEDERDDYERRQQAAQEDEYGRY